MGKKVGRNQPCPCGSGVKYKKCACRHLPKLSLDDLVYKNEIQNDRMVDGIKPVYCVSYTNLDNPDYLPPGSKPIVPIIDEFLEGSPLPIWTNCFWNSHALSLYEKLDDVIPVCGWYGNSLNQRHRDNLKKWESENKIVEWDDDLLWVEEDEAFYNMKEKIRFTRHSWNVALNRSTEFGDVYFDLGVDVLRQASLPNDLSDRWYYYIEVYRPSTYTKMPNYTDQVKTNPDELKKWMDTALLVGIKLDNDTPLNLAGINTKFKGKYEIVAANVWLNLLYRMSPGFERLVKSNVEIQHQLNDLVNQFANAVGRRITKPEDHQLLDKYFPHEIWDYYNPNNHKYEQWKRSEWRQYTK